MTFWDIFYGTHTIDKEDGKPHLKEDLFHPFKDIWRLIFIFCGIVGSIMFPLMVSVHVQYFINAKTHPKFYEQPEWQDYILVASFAIAFVVGFLCLVIPRVFRHKGAMRLCFFSALIILNAAQVYSPYALGVSTFSFSLETLLSILWVIFSGCIETFLYSCGISMYAAGLTFVIQFVITKVRVKKLQKAGVEIVKNNY